LQRHCTGFSASFFKGGVSSLPQSQASESQPHVHFPGGQSQVFFGEDFGGQSQFSLPQSQASESQSQSSSSQPQESSFLQDSFEQESFLQDSFEQESFEQESSLTPPKRRRSSWGAR
jgi:hypothetical protein